MQQQQPTLSQPTRIQNVPITPIKNDFPTSTTCPHCHQNITTRIEKKNGLVTWGSCAGIAILGAPFGCFLGCCLIPFCVDALKDTIHYCPNCTQVVGHSKILDI